MFDDVTDEQLEAELLSLERALEKLRKHFGRFRDGAHTELDRSVEAARARVDELLRQGVRQLAHAGGTPVAIAGLADAIALTDRTIVARWHQLVDAEPGGDGPAYVFGSMTRAEYDAGKASLERAVAARTRELGRRAEEGRHAAAIAELGDVPRGTSPATRLEQGDPGYGAQVERDQQTQEAIPHG